MKLLFLGIAARLLVFLPSEKETLDVFLKVYAPMVDFFVTGRAKHNNVFRLIDTAFENRLKVVRFELLSDRINKVF
jgi:hypothetical protein